MKNIIRNLVIIAGLTVFGFSNKTIAQQTDKYKIVSDKISNKNFVFTATSLTPMSGRLRILTSEYDVKVNEDSIISYLPYFGTTQLAPTNSDDAGVMFTSKDFDYVTTAGKKQSWDVEIKFKDQKNTQQFSFIIYDDGTASLNVISSFRDPITYRGSIKL